MGDEAKPEVKFGTLLIELDGLANDKGEVLVGLYNDPKKFPKENQALHNLKGKPSKKKCVIKAMKLPYGEYGVAAMHDENKSGNMDYNLIGLPKEIYGFSNNKRPVFGPPGFKACRFVIDKTGGENQDHTQVALSSLASIQGTKKPEHNVPVFKK